MQSAKARKQEEDTKQSNPVNDYHCLTTELMDVAKWWSAQMQRHHYQKQDTELATDTKLALPPNPLRVFLSQPHHAKGKKSYPILFFNMISCVQR